MDSPTLILDINQLSLVIHLAVKTIRTTLVRNPTALPPRLIIPGQKRLLWLWSDVVEWYSKQVRSQGSNPEFAAAPRAATPPETQIPREKKPGRPTKVEQLRRRQSQGG